MLTTAPRHTDSARGHACGNLVEAHDLVKTYPKGVRALDGVSLSIAPGEVFGLLGPNGAGKSTTVKILTTLARPDSGSARVAGHDVLRHPRRVRQVIGAVSQRSGADPMATGRDNLTLQGRLYGLRGAALGRRVTELLDRFDLTGAAGRLVRTYSGGMQRRLDVALGLVNRPEVLFLDEPTTGLDPLARTAMWSEIARLAGEESMAILLTTHYLDEADRLADRLAIVDDGRIVATGTPDSLKGELHGDAVQVELGDLPDRRSAGAATAALATVPGLRDITLDGRRLAARAHAAASATPAVLAALDQAGLRVATVTIARPSLDDVYLRYTGRRFADVDAGVAAAGEPADGPAPAGDRAGGPAPADDRGGPAPAGDRGGPAPAGDRAGGPAPADGPPRSRAGSTGIPATTDSPAGGAR